MTNSMPTTRSTPSRLIRSHLIVAFVLAVALISPSGFGADQKAKAVITIKIPKDDESTADATTLEIEVANESSQELIFRSMHPLKDFSFKIVDCNGTDVSLTRWGERIKTFDEFGFATVHLKPGESRTFELNLARAFDLSLGGKYSVVVSRKLNKEQVDSKELVFEMRWPNS
jgi:hypothetical protein